MRSTSAEHSTPSPFDAPWFGVVCGASAALFYTLASICLRAVDQVDPAWVSCVKAGPTVLVAGAIVAIGWARGTTRIPRWPTLAALAASGLFVQVAGNVSNQWSLRIVGLAASVPLTFGTLIVSGALLGRLWLGEFVTPRSMVAIVLLLIAIPVLRLGADEAVGSKGHEATPTADSWLLTLGVGAACLSGVAYATQGAVIRRIARGAAPVPLALFMFSAIGVICLGGLSLARIGSRGMGETSQDDLGVMLLAGVFNAAGFFSIGKALQLTPMVQVNALNATQTAMAAIAGVAFFSEKPTWPLLIGSTLTIAGMLLTQRGNVRPLKAE